MKPYWQSHIWFWSRIAIIRIGRKDETKVIVAAVRTAFCEERYQDQLVSKQPGREFFILIRHHMIKRSLFPFLWYHRH